MTQNEMIEKLIEYMKAKIEQRDWHAVSDAANDLRVLEAQGKPFRAPITLEPEGVHRVINQGQRG